jgi:hypothetical protein
VAVEVWVSAVLRVVVGFVAIEAVGLGRLVVEVRRIGERCLAHV